MSRDDTSAAAGHGPLQGAALSPYRSGQAAVMYANLRLASILSVIPPSKPPSLPSLTLSVHRHVYA